MWTIARHASCCLEFDSCEQNSFISNCKVPPQYQCSGHKGHIFTKRRKGSTISMGKKLDGSCHAKIDISCQCETPWNKKWIGTNAPMIWNFETLKTTNMLLFQPVCVESWILCQKQTMPEGLKHELEDAGIYHIHHVKCCFSFPARIRVKTTNTTSFENHYLFALQLSFEVFFKKQNPLDLQPILDVNHTCSPNHPFCLDVFVVANPKNFSVRWKNTRKGEVGNVESWSASWLGTNCTPSNFSCCKAWSFDEKIGPSCFSFNVSCQNLTQWPAGDFGYLLCIYI